MQRSPSAFLICLGAKRLIKKYKKNLNGILFLNYPGAKLLERSSYLRRNKKKPVCSGVRLAGCAVPTLFNLFLRWIALMVAQLSPSEGPGYSRIDVASIDSPWQFSSFTAQFQTWTCENHLASPPNDSASRVSEKNYVKNTKFARQRK